MPKPITQFKNDKLFAIFAGEPGCGKSSAAVSVRRPGRKMCMLDFDLRARGILDGIKSGWLKDPDDIHVEQFHPSKGYDPLNSFFEMRQQAFKSKGEHEYDTMEIASLFAFSRMLKLTSHKLQKGKTIGNLRIDGPADFNFEISGTHQCFDFLRSFGCNLILDAHLVPKWGKYGFDDEGNPIDAWGKDLDKDGAAALQYSENHIIGEEINVRAKYASTVMSYFDDIYRFGKESNKRGQVTYTVEFSSVFAKNTFGIKPGVHDITGQNFYDYFKKLTGWEG